MGIFEGVLLCSDIDGTLVYNNEVPKANAEAIEYFKSEGGLFTLSTGRQPSYFTEKFSIEPNTYIISVNGTVISDLSGKKVIYDKKLSLDFALEVCDFVMPRYDLETFWAADLSYDVLEFGKLPVTDANKMMFVPKKEEDALRLMNELREKYKGLVDISRSWPTGVEVICEGSGKGYCVKKLKELTHSRLLVCAGDYDNDITMLRAADIGYAIRSGVKAAHDAADRITKSSAQMGAIAEIIKELEIEILNNQE